MYANTCEPALSATCHEFRLPHSKLCSRSNVFRIGQQSHLEDGQICKGIGGTAARPKNMNSMHSEKSHADNLDDSSV